MAALPSGLADDENSLSLTRAANQAAGYDQSERCYTDSELRAALKVGYARSMTRPAIKEVFGVQ